MTALSRIAVIGLGYVGLTTAACLADLGNEVVALDTDLRRVAVLRRGRLPLYEPGLAEAVQRNAAARRLRFTTSYREALSVAEFAFIAVGTPEKKNGHADTAQVIDAVARMRNEIQGPLVIVNKSTVPIGTGNLVRRELERAKLAHAVDVVSNPEFLREGSALSDFMHPDRVVIGAESAEVADRVAKLYEPLGAPIVVTTTPTAEMIKYASNALLATRISLINEIAWICEQVGADVKIVADGAGLDRRIGRSMLEAGVGFGGSCLPKDVRALASMVRSSGKQPELLNAVLAINSDQRRVVIRKLRECLGQMDGRRVGLWGLSFKPNTDDLREAPSLDITRELLRLGASVRAYDPAASAQARRLLPRLSIRRDPYAAAAGADAVVLMTEWNEFRELDLERVRRMMRQPVLIDGRNVYDPGAMRDLGFIYRGIGRN